MVRSGGGTIEEDFLEDEMWLTCLQFFCFVCLFVCFLPAHPSAENEAETSHSQQLRHLV